jgi:uncharacterized RDD family membrane protein YckC
VRFDSVAPTASLDAVMPHSELSEDYDEVLVPAEIGSRLGAFVIDWLCTLILVDVVLYLLTIYSGRQSLNWFLMATGLVFGLIYLINFILFPSFTGQSFGKTLLGIHIIHDDGRPLTFTGAIKRHLIGYLISAVPLMFGFISAMWSPRGRAWHDKLAKTVVVRNA